MESGEYGGVGGSPAEEAMVGGTDRAREAAERGPGGGDEDKEPERPGRLARSTAFFSLATGLSRIAGLVREIFAASYFGVGGAMSAFTIAFQIPNTVRSLFADAAIQAAFVPVFTEELEHGRKREAFRLRLEPDLPRRRDPRAAHGAVHPDRAADHRGLRPGLLEATLRT